jgi:hypothetical protein
VNSHALPRIVKIAIEASGVPLAGAWVHVALGTTRKNPHGMLAGPTNENGEVVVTDRTIEENVNQAVETSPMDYLGLHAWDGSIRVEAMNRDRVAKVIDAVEIWENLGSLQTEDNLRLLRRYAQHLESIAGAELAVRAYCEPTAAADIETVGTQA